MGVFVSFQYATSPTSVYSDDDNTIGHDNDGPFVRVTHRRDINDDYFGVK